MAHYWLIVTLSWIGSVSLQYISNSYQDQLIPEDTNNLNSLDPVLNPVHKIDSFNSVPPSNNLDRFVREPTMLDILFPQILLPPSVRVRRTPEETVLPYLDFADTDAAAFVPSDSRISSVPLVIQKYEGLAGTAENASELGGQNKKRSFSPWGGKRDSQSNTWTWKRSTMREPSMPKRVRFSPWGGKRSSQLIFKPGTKALKIIFSKTVPDLTRIISSYSPNGSGSFKMAGFEVVPAKSKRHPVRILTLTSKLDERTSKDALPFRAFIESMKIYKPGHPYSDVNLRKDDKRKVKFSAWGGKRSAPIIGPIWSPSTQTIQDHTLDKILLIRKDENVNENMIKALLNGNMLV